MRIAIVAGFILVVVWLLTRRVRVGTKSTTDLPQKTLPPQKTFLQLLFFQGYSFEMSKYLSLVKDLELAIARLEDSLQGDHLNNRVIAESATAVSTAERGYELATVSVEEARQKIVRGFERTNFDPRRSLELLGKAHRILELIKFADSVKGYNKMTQQVLALLTEIDGLNRPTNPYYIVPHKQ